MKDSLSLRFLYHTIPGRCVLRVLIAPGISKFAGKVLSTGLSKYFVEGFRKKNNISLEGYAVPRGGFASFNDFFYRKRKMVVFDRDETHFCSPCDALLTCVRLTGQDVLDVKHTKFSVQGLLQDEKLAWEYRDGYALIFRLTPAHYHRYSYQSDGTRLYRRRIDGVLHCVRPIATEKIPVFVQNAREYEVIETAQWGKLVQMEVGALMVGKITNLNPMGGEIAVRKGQEKGYFEFGGSTIIMLVKKDTIALRKSVLDKVNDEGEIPVRAGEWIADALHS